MMGEAVTARCSAWRLVVLFVYFIDVLLSSSTCSRTARRWSSATCAPEAVERVRAAHPQVEAAAVDELPTLDLDVYAPCALGGSLAAEVVDGLKARMVCGAANNQLAEPGVDAALDTRGILYVPDYLANGGGLIQVGDEALHAHCGGFRFDRAKARAASIADTTLAVLRAAAAQGVLPATAADGLAERRMAESPGCARSGCRPDLTAP